MRRRLREVSSKISGALAGPRDEAPVATEVTPGEEPAVSTTDVLPEPHEAAPSASVEGDLACVAAVRWPRRLRSRSPARPSVSTSGSRSTRRWWSRTCSPRPRRPTAAGAGPSPSPAPTAPTRSRSTRSSCSPGAEALVSPEWVPYADRIQPGDLSPGDLLPPKPDDPRLVPSYADPDAELFDEHWELGLGRVRVLSLDGRADAAERWYDGDQGPRAPIAKAAPATCVDCGFLVPLGGSLRQLFGACANAMAPDDGKVVVARPRLRRAQRDGRRAGDHRWHGGRARRDRAHRARAGREPKRSRAGTRRARWTTPTLPSRWATASALASAPPTCNTGDGPTCAGLACRRDPAPGVRPCCWRDRAERGRPAAGRPGVCRPLLLQRGDRADRCTRRRPGGCRPPRRARAAPHLGDRARRQRLAVFHPGVGAPLAAGFLEEAIALGCKRFVAVGGPVPWCPSSSWAMR